MVGAVAGSPGTIPTNWGGGSGGLTRTVVGLGTENGLSYIDVRYNGTANSIVATFSFETNGGITAAQNQVWANSVWVKNIATPAAANQVLLTDYEFNSFGTYLVEGSANIGSSITTTLKRFEFIRTLTNVNTARVQPLLQFIFTIGSAYDFTIRIAAPQMELGAYATTFIPTTTAAVTRLADSASKADVASLIGQSQGTLYAEVSMSNWESPNRLIAVSDGTTNNRIVILQSTANRFRVLVTNGTVGQVDFSSGTLTNGNYKLALAYAENNFTLFINGIEAGNDLSGTVPACSDIYLGKSESSSPSQFIANPIAQAAIFPTRLSNEELALITTI
jgi:hypothetical protein